MFMGLCVYCLSLLNNKKCSFLNKVIAFRILIASNALKK